MVRWQRQSSDNELSAMERARLRALGRNHSRSRGIYRDGSTWRRGQIGVRITGFGGGSVALRDLRGEEEEDAGGVIGQWDPTVSGTGRARRERATEAKGLWACAWLLGQPGA